MTKDAKELTNSTYPNSSSIDTGTMRVFLESTKTALNKGESIVSNFPERLDKPDQLMAFLRDYAHVVLDVHSFKNRFLTKIGFFTENEDYQECWIRSVLDEGRMMIYALDEVAQTLDTLERDDLWRVGTQNDLSLAIRDPITLKSIPYPFKFTSC